MAEIGARKRQKSQSLRAGDMGALKIVFLCVGLSVIDLLNSVEAKPTQPTAPPTDRKDHEPLATPVDGKDNKPDNLEIDDSDEDVSLDDRFGGGGPFHGRHYPRFHGPPHHYGDVPHYGGRFPGEFGFRRRPFAPYGPPPFPRPYPGTGGDDDDDDDDDAYPRRPWHHRGGPWHHGGRRHRCGHRKRPTSSTTTTTTTPDVRPVSEETEEWATTRGGATKAPTTPRPEEPKAEMAVPDIDVRTNQVAAE